MIDEHSLVKRGAHAVAIALEQDDGNLNVDVLAQACARRARASLCRTKSLGWANAAIACYEKAARGRSVGYDRQGSEVPLFGLVGLMILRWGAKPGHRVLDPERVRCWIQEELEQQESPDSFREALNETVNATRREHAICLKERLAVGLALYEKGLLHRTLEPWIRSAGMLKDEPKDA